MYLVVLVLSCMLAFCFVSLGFLLFFFFFFFFLFFLFWDELLDGCIMLMRSQASLKSPFMTVSGCGMLMVVCEVVCEVCR